MDENHLRGRCDSRNCIEPGMSERPGKVGIKMHRGPQHLGQSDKRNKQRQTCSLNPEMWGTLSRPTFNGKYPLAKRNIIYILRVYIYIYCVYIYILRVCIYIYYVCIYIYMYVLRVYYILYYLYIYICVCITCIYIYYIYSSNMQCLSMHLHNIATKCVFVGLLSSYIL